MLLLQSISFHVLIGEWPEFSFLMDKEIIRWIGKNVIYKKNNPPQKKK